MDCRDLYQHFGVLGPSGFVLLCCGVRIYGFYTLSNLGQRGQLRNLGRVLVHRFWWSFTRDMGRKVSDCASEFQPFGSGAELRGLV